MPAYIIFDDLGFLNLPVAFLFKLRGFKVFYLNLPAVWNTERTIAFFSRLGLKAFDYSYKTQHYEADLYKNMGNYTNQIFDDVVYPSLFSSAIESHFKLDEELKKKFRIALLLHFQDGRLSKFLEMVGIARHFKRETKAPVFLFAKNNLWTEKALRLEGDFQNRCPRWWSNVLGGAKILGLLVGRLKKIFKKKVAETSVSGPKVSPVNTAEFEIVFFPHAGIFYGDLFKKDYAHSQDPQSPLYFRKILHVSANEEVSDFEKSIRYYEEMNIPHVETTYGRDLLKNLKQFFFLIKNQPFRLLKELATYGLVRFELYFFSFLQLNNAFHFIERFPKAKICLIGFDVLFSPYLSLAFSARGVKTIAVQERYIAPFTLQFRMNVDYYFVQGEVVKEWVESHPYHFAISECKVLGAPRLDLFYQLRQQNIYDAKYSPIKKEKKLVLAMDYTIKSNALANRVCDVTWKSSKKFYRDMISLAKAFPNIHIVIKGKDSHKNLYRLDYFKDIVADIATTDNINFEEDIHTYTPERIVELADIGIARSTTLADEMLGTGKPVLIYDYWGYPGPFFDYLGLPVLAYDYDQLKTMLGNIVNKNQFLSPGDFENLISRCYHRSFHGNVQAQYREEIERIFREVKAI